MECRLCKCNDLYLFYNQGNTNEFKYYKCPKCGLVNLDMTNLNHTENQEKYALTYPDPNDKKINKSSYDSYVFIKKNIKTKGRYLDIGCGNGALINFAHKDGWQVSGLELSPFLAQNIREKLKFDVEVANFMDFSNFKQKFDLVSLKHVLEHLPDSILAMTKINRLLNENGKAMLEFPNINGIGFRIRRLSQKLGFKKKYASNYQPGHCNEFSKKPYQYLAEQTGFKIVKWETYSSKPIFNFFYSLVPISTKARVLIQKLKEV